MRHPRIILLLSVLMAAAIVRAQESPELPKVVRHEEPRYPPIARTAHVQGDVRIKIMTDGESVVNAEAEDGPPLLRKAAVDNARAVPRSAIGDTSSKPSERFSLLGPHVLKIVISTWSCCG